MQIACDLCGNATLEDVYRPDGTQRGLTVFLCTHCGLLQSLPRVDRAARAPMAVSSGADWGNVRYGKGFRAEANMEQLARFVDFGNPLAVLDVGANRGAFANLLLTRAPKAAIVAVEPDERVRDAYAGKARIRLVPQRIEDVELPDESVDLIYSCHTIEHLRSPHETLAAHWAALKPGGILFLEAPNTALIGGDDIVEEWFIDKHLYHFSATTLARLVVTAGFRVLEGPNPKDRVNAGIVAQKTDTALPPLHRDQREVDSATVLVSAYQDTRTKNLHALKSVAREIEAKAHKRVAIWGAGRLFDSLVVHGGLDVAKLGAVADAHLAALKGEMHGSAVCEPASLGPLDPGLIVVMSRSFADEIVEQAKTICPRAEIVTYAELLRHARTPASV